MIKKRDFSQSWNHYTPYCFSIVKCLLFRSVESSGSGGSGTPLITSGFGSVRSRDEIKRTRFKFFHSKFFFIVFCSMWWIILGRNPFSFYSSLIFLGGMRKAERITSLPYICIPKIIYLALHLLTIGKPMYTFLLSWFWMNF